MINPLGVLAMMRIIVGLILVATIALAAVEAGPKPVTMPRQRAIVGADPMPICNAVDKFDKKCPDDSFGSACGKTYITILEPLPGALLKKRYDNDTMATCDSHPSCPETIPLKETAGKCDEKQVPGDGTP